MSKRDDSKQAIDSSIWEWLPPLPVTSASYASSASCRDPAVLNDNNSRYIYHILDNSNFWRFDTITNNWTRLASPSQPFLSTGTLRLITHLGYYNRVISATSNTLVTGMPTGRSAVGYKIRIVSGKGMGQERIITDVSDPVVADYGVTTGGDGSNLTDTNKNWYGFTGSSASAYSDAYTGSTPNFNGWAGYVVRTTAFGSGINQVRKILYNSNQNIVVGYSNLFSTEPYSNVSFITAPAAGTSYQIESSTVTVDTAWDTTPDQTSRFMIESGQVWALCLQSNSANYALQFYDILSDTWYATQACSGINFSMTKPFFDEFGYNNYIYWRGIALSGSVSNLTTDSIWTANEWVGYKLYIFSGSGRGQITEIISNTDTTLTFNAVTTPIDNTSRFEILGIDGGKSTGSNGSDTLIDTTKTWVANRWTNYGIRILYGKGAGQTFRIISNTSNTLTIHNNWSILPDSTSVYIIQGDSDSILIGEGAGITVHSLKSGLATAGRQVDYGCACIVAALRANSSHEIEDISPIVLSSLTGTTTITATSTNPHCLKVGDWVSIRGVTSAAADQYNITGLYQVASVPSVTSFTYTPYAAGTGTYAYLTAHSTSNLSDASKDFRDNVSSSTNTSITFARNTPSNINGWYASGTNISPGAKITSGAGTTTVQLSEGVAAPTGVISFCPWGPHSQITSTYSSGGSNDCVVTMAANTNANINNWMIAGGGTYTTTGVIILTLNVIMPGTYVMSGAGTTNLVLSKNHQGTASGTYYYSPPNRAAAKLCCLAYLAPLANGLTPLTIDIVNYAIGPRLIPYSTFGNIPSTAFQYAICDPYVIGANYNGNSNDNKWGVATTNAVDSLVDGTVGFSKSATAASGSSTITLTTAVGDCNGYFITGTGIAIGTRVISGGGTTSLSISQPTTGAVSGTVTIIAWGPSGGNSAWADYVTPRASGPKRHLKMLTNQGGNGQIGSYIPRTCDPASATIIVASGSNITQAAGTVYSWNSVGQMLSSNGGNGIHIIHNNSNPANSKRGRFIYGVTANGADGLYGVWKIDINGDRLTYPFIDSDRYNGGNGYEWFMYDGKDRLYFYSRGANQSVSAGPYNNGRMNYIDLNADVYYSYTEMPYAHTSTQLGAQRMQIYQNKDRLRFCVLNGHGRDEYYRVILTD